MNRKSPRSQTKLDTTMCPERDDKRSQESCTVPVSVSPVNIPFRHVLDDQ